MYIRIQDRTIRYRVSKIECQKLLDGAKLQDHFPAAPDKDLTYSVDVTDGPGAFVFEQSQNHFKLSVNKQRLKEELDVRPSKMGLAILNKTAELSEPVAYLQIDLKNKK